MKSVKDKSLTTKIQKKIINVNKYGYNKDDNARIVQLTAFFHILKKELGESCYTEIANAKMYAIFLLVLIFTKLLQWPNIIDP